MNLLEMLYHKTDLILLDTTDGLVKAHLTHYNILQPELVRFRLMKLFNALVKSIEKNSCEEITDFMGKISGERYELGFELYEVQTAINILEESLWKKIQKYIDDDKQIAAMKQVSDILSKAKDKLVDEYYEINKEYVGSSPAE